MDLVQLSYNTSYTRSDRGEIILGLALCNYISEISLGYASQSPAICRCCTLGRKCESRPFSIPRNNAFNPAPALLPGHLSNDKVIPLRLRVKNQILGSKLLVPLHEVCIWVGEREIGIEVPEVWWCISVCEVRVEELLVP